MRFKNHFLFIAALAGIQAYGQSSYYDDLTVSDWKSLIDIKIGASMLNYNLRNAEGLSGVGTFKKALDLARDHIQEIKDLIQESGGWRLLAGNQQDGEELP